jgi:hypothetical protein
MVSIMLLCVPNGRYLSDEFVERHELSRVRLSRRLN